MSNREVRNTLMEIFNMCSKKIAQLTSFLLIMFISSSYANDVVDCDECTKKRGSKPFFDAAAKWNTIYCSDERFKNPISEPGLANSERGLSNVLYAFVNDMKLIEYGMKTKGKHKCTYDQPRRWDQLCSIKPRDGIIKYDTVMEGMMRTKFQFQPTMNPLINLVFHYGPEGFKQLGMYIFGHMIKLECDHLRGK